MPLLFTQDFRNALDNAFLNSLVDRGLNLSGIPPGVSIANLIASMSGDTSGNLTAQNNFTVLGSLTVAGPIVAPPAVITISSSQLIPNGFEEVHLHGYTAPVVLTLPPAASLLSGFEILVVDIDGAAQSYGLSVQVSGGDSIVGAGTAVNLLTNYGTLRFKRITSSVWMLVLEDQYLINVREHGVFGDGNTDDTAAIKAACAVLQNQGSGTLLFPPGEYKIYGPSSGTPGPLGNFHGMDGVQIISNGATLAIDPAYSSSVSMFVFTGCSNIKVDGFKVTGPSIDITPSTPQTNEFVRVIGANYASGLSMPSNILHSCTGLVVAGTFGDVSTDFKNIHIGNLYVTDGYYGINCQFSGSNLVCDNLTTDTVHRSYFPYGVHNHRVKIRAKDASSVDVLLKTYQGSVLQDVEVWYERFTDTQNSTDGSEAINFQFGDQTPGTFRNIRLHLNVQWNATGQTGAGAVRITKFDNGGGYDQSDRGHTLDNVVIDGYLKGTPHYSAEWLVFMDNLNNWGTGDFFRNVRLENLSVDSTAPHGMLFFHSPFQNPIVFDDVRAPGISLDLQLSSGQTVGNFAPIYNNGTVFANQAALTVFQDVSNTSIQKYMPQTFHQATGTQDVNMTLPASVVGMEFSFFREATHVYSIFPATGEYISSGAANQPVVLNAPGAYVKLKCIIAGHWEIVASNGTMRASLEDGSSGQTGTWKTWDPIQAANKFVYVFNGQLAISDTEPA